MAFYVGVFFLLGVLVEFLIHFISSAIYEAPKSISLETLEGTFLQILPLKTCTN